MRASSVDQAIVDVLVKEKAHMTSLQLFDAVNERLPAVNLSTIYRALERLTRRGTVSVSDMGTGSAVYELLGPGIHHHLVCQRCNRVTDIGHDVTTSLFSTIQSAYHFTVKTNHLILFGICESCSNKENESAR
jgi:Fur family ferric uptake transcriptional regulator